MKFYMVPYEPIQYLYVHENKINGKKYFGITMRNPKERWGHNGRGYCDCTYFHSAIKKYGWDNFTHKIILNIYGRNLIGEFEKFFIGKYKTNDPKYGYNCTTGGDVTIPNEMVKLKMRKASPNKSPVVCLETGKIYESGMDASRDLCVDRSAMRGVCLGMGIHKTIGGYHFMFLEDYKKATPEEIEQRLGRRYMGRPRRVVCVETGITYDSIKDARQKTGVHGINGCCRLNTINKTAGGYHWLYEEDYLQKSKEELEELLQIKSLTEGTPVVCLETGITYNSVCIAKKLTNVDVAGIRKCCEHKMQQTCGTHWLYKSEYDTLDMERIKQIINSKPTNKYRQRKVLCLDTNQVYSGTGEATKKTGISQSSICACCTGRQFAAGGLQWKYIEE